MSTFDNIPPFPDNLPVVPLKVISFAKLAKGDLKEEEKLFEAAKGLGFFYLDLRNSSQKQDALLDNAEHLFKLAPEFFKVPLEEKIKYDLTKHDGHGYKSLGQSAMDKKGTPDETEFLNISKDDIFVKKTGTITGPDILQQHFDLFQQYMQEAHSVLSTILKALANQLNLPEQKLASLHRIAEPSGDQVRITYAPPSPANSEEDEQKRKLGEHTDFGSLSLLFNRLGGLQVLPPNETEWRYVLPVKGHAIINLGDAMVKFTNGLFRSNIHRVVKPPGAQGSLTRVSLVYFMRPEDNAILGRLEGSSSIPSLTAGKEEEKILARDWIQRRIKMRMKGYFSPENWHQTEGTENAMGLVS
ncbi:oxidoreductase [Xylogone sp. PMI_703]|nr:oxidoreductase [Xylogone sp. PMI_703]